MIEIIGFIALVIWVGNKWNSTAAGLLVIGGIILFLALGRSVENDEWKARRNWVSYWKKQR